MNYAARTAAWLLNVFTELGLVFTDKLLLLGDNTEFYTCSYNHARRLRLEKLSSSRRGLAKSRSPSGYFKPILDPDVTQTAKTL
jgi:hypothetical protein